MAKIVDILLSTVSVLACLGIAATAGAAVIIENPSGAPSYTGDSNIIFNACGGNEVAGPALTVTGCLNDDHAYLVDFTGQENLVIGGGGQATVLDAGGNGFGYLRVSTQAGSFATFITNIDASDFVNGTPQSGQVEITPYIGGIAQTSSLFSLVEEGNNWFGFSMDNADLFSAIEFEIVGWGPDSIQFVGVEFESFSQNRLGPGDGDNGPGPDEISEPAALGFLGLGLLGLGVMLRRRWGV